MEKFHNWEKGAHTEHRVNYDENSENNSKKILKHNKSHT